MVADSATPERPTPDDPRSDETTSREAPTAGYTRLLPLPRDEILDARSELESEARFPYAHRPWLLTNMIMSLDGAISIDARSGGLGGPADQQMLSSLRSLADVIVVGAATAVAEAYRRPEGSPSTRRRRARRGQNASPRLAIVSGSLSLPIDLPAFTPGASLPAVHNRPDHIRDDGRVLVLTGSAAPPERVEELSQVCEVVQFDTPRVDPVDILAELHRRRARTVLLEGGPILNGQFAAADLIDEWNLTLSPLVVGGDAGRATQGPLVGDPENLELTRLWLADGLLFGRWVRSPNSD